MNKVTPDFIIIGAMKCGTTSLYYYLRNHPNIYMPNEKELNFFIEEKNFNKGEDWYYSNFNDKFMINGEASPNYTKKHIFPGVPERMHKVVPQAKLIFLYRNPAERSWSHYIHSLASGLETKQPKQVFTSSSNYVLTSKYYWQLEPFLKYYDKNQILLINIESLKNKRKETVERVYDFLGVEPYYDEAVIEKERHQSKVKTKRSLLNSLLLKTKFGNSLKKALPEELKNWYRKLSEKPLPSYEFTPELNKTVEEHVAEDDRKFRELLHSGSIESI